MTKEIVFNAFVNCIREKIAGAQAIFDESVLSVQSETKSTAGDKHETGRALAQLEMEKAGKHVHEMQQFQLLFPRIQPNVTHTHIQLGSLIKSEQGFFYLSAGIGKINLEGTSVFCIGMLSPIAQEMLGKKVGDVYTIAGKSFTITEIL